MDARAIRRLRLKFILISTVTYFLVMFFMGLFINASNFLLSRQQIHTVLDYMLNEEMKTDEEASGNDSQSAESAAGAAGESDQQDEKSGDSDQETQKDEQDGKDKKSKKDEKSDKPEYHENMLNEFSAEFHYSARYFSAILDKNGSPSEIKTAHIMALTREEASAMAVKAFSERGKFGRDGNYFYAKAKDENEYTHIIFLNCSAQIAQNLRILYISMLIAAAGLLITFVLVYISSYRVIQPEMENVRRQKQFITNASHELKTPLAVIRANTEIEEMIHGQNEWTESTMRQVERLDGLIRNLVMITRAQEKEDRSVMTRVNVTQPVQETVGPYESIAQQDHKELILNLQPDIEFVADESKIRQLASLLIDNAFKYCDENGRVTFTLDTLRKGRTLRMICSNSYAEGANVDYSRFFDRFYREDSSHNLDKGGYGIGLSIAESICQQYGGSIDVSWKDGEISFTCLLN